MPKVDVERLLSLTRSTARFLEFERYRIVHGQFEPIRVDQLDDTVKQ